MSDWYAPLREIESLGSTAARPGSLAGLHEARKTHKGQFFTVDAIAGYAWRLVEPAIERALGATSPGQCVSLFDNSVGSGRLFQFANPAKHTLSGVDIHEASISRVMRVAEAAGFMCELIACGMEAARASGFAVGLITPPFSLHLESPLLEPFPCTTWGRFGEKTSAVSHAYALAQALDACEIVVAVLPSTYAATVAGDPQGCVGEDQARRLRAVIDLPAGAFRDEGTQVRTSLVVFSAWDTEQPLQRLQVSALDEAAPDLGLACSVGASRARLVVRGIDDDGPVITRAVTGDASVRVIHDGRRIGLRFACGLVEARVLNAVLKERIEAYRAEGVELHRYPKGVRYTGQGILDVEAHLAQEHPLGSFNRLLETIVAAGGTPIVDEGLRGYIARRAHQVQREREPFRHVVWTDGAGHDGKVVGRARKTHVADAKVWGSPAIKTGQEVEFSPVDGGLYRYSVGSGSYELSLDEVRKRFEVAETIEAGWRTLYDGLPAAFPVMAHELRKRSIALGLDKWLWPYQLDDAIEAAMCPKGGVIAWKQALGKGRLSAALILLSGVKHGLIVVEAYLVPEMVDELKKLPVAAEAWQVIESRAQLTALRTINVISYERLRRPMYAKRLRRRIGLLVADEGDALAHMDSQQTGAAWQVSARRKFVLTGSPIANYPRDTLPLMVFACGDGTAAQPYGYRRGFMEPRLVQSMAWCARGIDQFRKSFCSFEWISHAFAEGLTDGAKREVPRIANLDAYRRAIAPHIKRRLPQEPEVASYVRIPTPTEILTECDWDAAHLSFYLKTAEEFATWYREVHREKGKNINLVALLARIGAVSMAANCPQHGVRGIGTYWPLTSKQRLAVQRLEELTAAGHKNILFAQNPETLEILARELAARGVESVVFHGKRPIKERTEELNARFRYGDCPNLLASFGVTQRGHNLFQANRAVLYDRQWSYTAEDQAILRLCRPQQTREVVAERLHICGSIDEYQAQMVAFKHEASRCGLDWATPELDDVEFLHLDTILGRFCEDLSKLYGVKRQDLRKVLAGNDMEVAHAA